MENGNYSATSCGSAALRAFPTIAARNKKAIVFASLHQRWLRIGAADEARTRYLHLGKVALYQMSYGRISGAFIPAPSRAILANFGVRAKACKARFCGEKEKVLHDFRRGASDRNRTNDTGIFSPLLYRLSYRGITGAFVPAPSQILSELGPPQRSAKQRFVGKRRNFSVCCGGPACRTARQTADIPTKRPGSGSNRRPPA